MGATFAAVRPAEHLSAATATIRALAGVAAATAATSIGSLASASGVASSTSVASERASESSVASAQACYSIITAAAAAATVAAIPTAAASRQHSNGAADATEIRTADLRERTAKTQKTDRRFQRVLDTVAGSGLPEESGIAGRHGDQQESDVRLRQRQRDLRDANDSGYAAESAHRQVGFELLLRSDRSADGEEDSGHVRAQREAEEQQPGQRRLRGGVRHAAIVSKTRRTCGLHEGSVPGSHPHPRVRAAAASAAATATFACRAGQP